MPGSLVWPGVEPGLELKVLPSPHFKSQVVLQLRDLNSVILRCDSWPLAHCVTLAGHLTSLLQSREKGKLSLRGL